MEFRTFYVLIAIIFTPYTANGKFVSLRQILSVPSSPAASTNATLLNGLLSFADTLIQELQSTRNEVRAAQSEINVMKKDATLTSAMLANVSLQINRAEAGLEIAKLNVIKCLPKQRSRPLVGVMKSGDFISVDEKFCSENGKTCLFMQGYINPVLYETWTYLTLWNLNTNINPVRQSCEATMNMQADGNLCIYNKVTDGATPLWCAKGESGAELAFESDGHLCLKNIKGQSCKWTTR